MKSSMQKIFSALKSESRFDIDGYYLKGEDPDCDLLKKAEIIDKNSHDFSPYQLLLIKYKTKKLLIVLSAVSFGIEFKQTDNLMEDDLTPGIIALFLSELKPKRLAAVSDESLENEIFYPLDEVQDYKGHDSFAILKFFGSLKVFYIKDTLNPTIPDCIIDFSISNPNFERAVHSDNLINSIRNCLNVSNKEIKEQIVKILWVNDFETAYIKLYQLIEMLYPLPYVKSVHSDVGEIKHSILELLNILVDKLDWKYTEINALERLLNEIPKDKMPIIKGFSEFSESDNVYLKTAKVIYKIRCKIVHKRLKQKNVVLDKNEWEYLFEVVLVIINQLYIKYSSIIFETES